MAQFPTAEERNALADGCERCPALVEARECISWGNGPLDATVVVVGEAPAYGNPDAERWRGGNWTGLAYTSRHSGRRVRELLAAAGYGHDDCYFTNAVKCFPAAEDADGEAPTNREPTADERANCRPYLVREIESVAPSAVVTTGRHATESVLSVEGVTLDGFLDAVLEPFDSSRLGTVVLPLLHPSYQDVWLDELGYTRSEYVAAIRDALDSAADVG